jgi:uncharacterized damage-inducible protein DinB
MISCIDMLIEHNYSVRGPLLESLKQLDRKDFVRNLGVGTSSIRNVLVHLMNSEIYWMNIIGEEDTHALDPEEFADVDAIATTWKQIENEMRDILGSQSDASLQYVKRLRIGDDTVSFTIARALLHMVTHEAHHRGFIVGLLRQMGYQPPNMNMLKEITIDDGLL